MYTEMKTLRTHAGTLHSSSSPSSPVITRRRRPPAACRGWSAAARRGRGRRRAPRGPRWNCAAARALALAPCCGCDAACPHHLPPCCNHRRTRGLCAVPLRLRRAVDTRPPYRLPCPCPCRRAAACRRNRAVVGRHPWGGAPLARGPRRRRRSRDPCCCCTAQRTAFAGSEEGKEALQVWDQSSKKGLAWLASRAGCVAGCGRVPIVAAALLVPRGGRPLVPPLLWRYRAPRAAASSSCSAAGGGSKEQGVGWMQGTVPPDPTASLRHPAPPRTALAHLWPRAP